MKQALDAEVAAGDGLRLTGGPSQRLAVPMHCPSHGDEPVIRRIQCLVARRRTRPQRRQDLLNNQPTGCEAPKETNDCGQPRTLHRRVVELLISGGTTPVAQA